MSETGSSVVSLGQTPEIRRVVAPSEGNALLTVQGLTKHYHVPRRGFNAAPGTVRAVDGVSFSLERGKTLGIVGESGCGKSTLIRTLLRLETPTAGSARFDGADIFSDQGRSREFMRRIQVVFQDPYAALNPRMTIKQILSEPFRIHPEIARQNGQGERIRELVGQVGLREEHLSRYPHEFSGGQLQRIGIARALAMEPELLILDEPVSALDVSVQAQVINLLKRIQERFGVSFIFVSHDLSVVRHVSDQVAVMYMGKVVEYGDVDELYERPAHPYTYSLLSLEPHFDKTQPKRDRITLEGEVPSPLNPPSGCRFRTRCWKAQPICQVEPAARSVDAKAHEVACHFPTI